MSRKVDVKGVLKLLEKSAKDGDAKKIKEQMAKDESEVADAWLLEMAGRLGELEVARMLLDAGVDVNTIAKYEWLHLFKENVAKLLLEAGIKTDEGDGQWLRRAAYCGTPKMVKLLVDHGAKVDIREEGGSTPLIVAAKEGRTDVVRILLEAGADSNARDSQDKTVLMHAAAVGKGDMVRLLIKAGADVRAQTSENPFYTALDNAVGGKGTSRVDAARALIEAGADVNHSGGIWKTPRVLLWACWREGDPAIIKALIEAGAELNSNDGHYGTPLHMAARENRPDLVQVLLDAGADINAKIVGRPDVENEELGMTPLEVAKAKKRRKIIPLLEAALAGRNTSTPAPKAITAPIDQSVAASWKRIKAAIKKNGLAIKLRKGATDKKIKEIEEKLGVSLPDDFKESYRLHDGAEGEDSLVPLPDEPGIGYDFLSLHGIVDEWTPWAEGESYSRESEPAEGIRPGWWHKEWVPFASLGNGDSLCIDLTPTEKGTVGQVITMNHETGVRDRLAPSFTEWLAELAEDLESQVEEQ